MFIDMKNKKILFLTGLLFCVILFLGAFSMAGAETKCCVGITGTPGPENCADPQSDGTCAKGTPNPGNCSSLSDCGGSVGVGGSCSSGTCEFPNPIGVKTVSEFLNKFLTSLRGVVAVIAIIFIVLGGILYMLSAGVEKMITRAKLCWTGAVIGLAIVLAAPSFLTEILKILGGGSGVSAEGLAGPTLLEIGMRTLSLLLSVFGIIAIISLVVGGGMYLTAYGDDKRIETGKKTITFSIIGIIISLSAVVIISEISRIISGR
jgi:hypothetical protein